MCNHVVSMGINVSKAYKGQDSILKLGTEQAKYIVVIKMFWLRKFQLWERNWGVSYSDLGTEKRTVL